MTQTRLSADSSIIDVNAPSIARMFDFLRGGVDHYAADRQASRLLLEAVPDFINTIRISRNFLRQAVLRLCRDHQIQQFIDFGCGLPHGENPHHVAWRINPDVRVAYVDNDPAVIAHARASLDESANVTILRENVQNTGAILSDLRQSRFFDFDRPTAALFVSVLDCLNDDDEPAGLIRTLISQLPPGSCVAICHLVSPEPHVAAHITQTMRHVLEGRWGRVRTPAEVESWFTGLRPVGQEIGDLNRWRTVDAPTPRTPSSGWAQWGGVASM